MQKFSSVLYPPLSDLAFNDQSQGVDIPQWNFGDFDWEFFYDVVGLNIEETLFEVRLKSHCITLKGFIHITLRGMTVRDTVFVYITLSWFPRRR